MRAGPHRIAVLWVLLYIFLILSQQGSAQEKRKKTKDVIPIGTPILWREPTDIETRNLLLGAGGEEMRPDISRVTFIEVQTGGHSTKYRVSDAKGNEWVAKIGSEAKSETAANRVVWSVGYESEITYLVPRLTIEGKGTFDNVRLEARPKDIKRVGNWKWEDNPFKGKPELQGLKIMMLLINNWDIKDTNNEILVPRDAGTGPVEVRYIISDLGGTLGKTGGFISRSRNKPSDFMKAEFIENVKGDRIVFHYEGKYKKLFEDITVGDARWLSNWLRRLSDRQLKDAFQAANYSPQEIEDLSRAMRRRIDALVHVSGE